MKVLFRTLLSAALAVTSSIVLAVPNHIETSTPEARELEERASGTATVFTTCKKSGTFAMSFDDGPYPYGAEIASFFEQHGSLASFFVNGYNWDCIYDRADDLLARYKAGHLIGSHTWGHDDITTLSGPELNQQLNLVETALFKILGIKPRFFRPPYGSYNAAALKILKQRGYTVVTWDVDSGDSAGLSTWQSIRVYSKLYSKFPKPHMALNHETYSGTAHKVIQSVVPKLLAAGYKLTTISDCLGVNPYQSVGTPGRRDSSWTCDGTPGPGAPHRA